MLAKTVLAFAGLLASVSAIMVTSPTKDSKLDFSVPNEITWSSVSSDPTTFSIVLVDQTTMASTVIAATAQTSDGKYSFKNIAAAPGTKYRINLLSVDPKNTGILAQSDTFEIIQSTTTSTSSFSAISTSTSSTFTGFSNSTTTASDSSSATDAATTLATSATGAASTASKTTNAPATKSSNSAASIDRAVGLAAGPVLALLAMLI